MRRVIRLRGTLKSATRHDVEHRVSAVAVLGGVTAALNFQIIDVLGIELRSNGIGDVGIGNGNAINQPSHLMAAANVQLIVSDVCSGHKVGDQREAVCAISPRAPWQSACS